MWPAMSLCITQTRAWGLRVMTDREKAVATAKALQWMHSKLTAGEPRKWGKLPEDERRLWLQLARRAMKKLEEMNGTPDIQEAIKPGIRAASSTPPTDSLGL